MTESNTASKGETAADGPNDVPSRSPILTFLGYPLLVAGLFFLFTGFELAGAVLTISGVLLIGITELCFVISKNGARR
ncbi:MAG: hypothetical protein ACTJHU_09430 [Mycetocola sp.]